MLKIIFLPILLVFIGNVIAADVAICIVNTGLKNNPQYHNLATTESVFICDSSIQFTSNKQTLVTLYKNGWHLINMISPDPRYSIKDNKIPSPIYYFER